VQRQTSNILRELSSHDHLQAARLENTNRLVTGYDHAAEVQHLANGLTTSVMRLKGIISDDRVAAAVRLQAAETLSRTSRLLDTLKEALR
jgi:hypothetical protein